MVGYALEAVPASCSAKEIQRARASRTGDFRRRVRLRLRLRLRLIYLGRIAEKVKYITSLGYAPARREGSRTENRKIYEE